MDMRPINKLTSEYAGALALTKRLEYPEHASDQVLAALAGRYDRQTGELMPVIALDDTAAIRVAVGFSLMRKTDVMLGDESVSIDFAAKNAWLWLQGDVGTGKTIAATWWAQRNKAAWLFAAHLIDVNDAAREKLAAAAKAEYLVIDDVGTEYSGSSGWGISQIAGLLSLRYDTGKKKTLVTTNLTRQQVIARYGVRIGSRLDEHGYFIGLPDGDLRRTRPSEDEKKARLARGEQIRAQALAAAVKHFAALDAERVESAARFAESQRKTPEEAERLRKANERQRERIRQEETHWNWDKEKN